MELQKIIERLSTPEKLVDPQEISTLQGYLNAHITDLEEEAWEKQLVASSQLGLMLDIPEMSVGKAEVLWKNSKEYIDWKRAELTLKKLKRYRSDLKDRFSVLMNKRGY